MAPSTTKISTLNATYASPTSTQTFTHPITITSAPSVNITTLPQKAAYLASLREQAVSLQENINSFLTERMEEDKAAAAAATAASGEKYQQAKGGKKVRMDVDEEKEEENYGEEVIDDD